MALYHSKVGLPSWFGSPTGKIPLTYSQHARNASQTDRYGKIPLPPTLDTSKFSVVEMEEKNGKAVKILYRGSIDRERDLCIVVTDTGFVKTVWVNLSRDKHSTLDFSKYTAP